MPKVSKMNINFELLKVSQMTNLKISISPTTEKLETSNLAGKYHSKGSIGYSSSGGSNVISSSSHNRSLYLELQRGTVIKFG